MKRILIIVSLLFSVLFAMGQKTSLEHSRVPIYLTGGGCLGVTEFYDAGVSPLHYLGFALGVDFGLTVEWKKCRITLDNTVGGCLAAGNKADSKAGAFGITINNRIGFLYRVSEPADGLRLWVGGSFNPYTDIRINQKMMNAAVGLTSMYAMDGNFRLEFDIPSRRRTDLFMLFADITLPLVALGERPSYAYVYNATSSSDPVEYVLDGYEGFAKAMPGATTDIGIFFNLKNRNRIGLSYRWDYWTTRHASVHRFDNAYHTVNLKFMFNIN